MAALPRYRLLAPDRLPRLESSSPHYDLGFASTDEELDAVFRLRYDVFNLELNEGLDASHATGRDTDEYDATCHHLVVRERASGQPVGTYRLQTRDMAEQGVGFYAASEFHLDDLPFDVLDGALEIGRACIAQEHRSLKVLYLLWQGLGAYVGFNQLRYVFGCCSLTSQDAHEASRVYQRLKRDGHLHPTHHVRSRDELACYVDAPRPGRDKMPRLMRAYLSLGAHICSDPAMDREFGTVDYLALFDLVSMESSRLAFYRCS